MRISEADGSPQMKERTMQIDHLKTSIERDEYAVDPKAVAEAILALLQRRQNACS
jgi:anti-sigma28 factor (negative regulator of flagellin synthesis)